MTMTTLDATETTTELCVESPIGDLVVAGNDEFVTELLLDVPGRKVTATRVPARRARPRARRRSPA